MLNVQFVGSMKTSKRYVLIVNGNFVPFAYHHLDERNDRAFPQVIRARLETQTKNSDSLLSRISDKALRFVDLLAIAGKNCPQERRFEIEFLRFVQQSPELLRQTGTSERRTRLQISRRNV